MNSQMNNDTVVLQQNANIRCCWECEKCFHDLSHHEGKDINQYICCPKCEQEEEKEAQFLYRVNLLKEATECGIMKEITEEGKAFQLKMEQEDSEDEEEEEQIYCDHCSRHTNAETATECGWVGDEETGDWKCVMCVLIEKTLEEKRHAEIHNASLTKRVRNR
tara:strand:- start:1101 stop:1589 length:489 start_codon:yes stop_codon:yes gene_type:complete